MPVPALQNCWGCQHGHNTFELELVYAQTQSMDNVTSYLLAMYRGPLRHWEKDFIVVSDRKA